MRGGLDDPVEILFADGVAVGVGRGVAEVDRVGHAVVDGELDGVKIVAERLIQREHIALDAREQLGRGGRAVDDVAQVVRVARLVGHDANLGASDAVTAVVVVEGDLGLEEHHELVGFAVGLEKLLLIADFVDVFPAAAGVWFEVGGPADVFEDAVPVQREREIAERLRAAVRGMIFRGQDDGFGDGDAELGREAIVEKFLVGGPPKWVVDDRGAVERGVLEEGPVERHVLRDAVEDNGVASGLALRDLIDLDGLGGDAGLVHGVDAGDESLGESAFFTEKEADFFHGSCRVRSE